MRQTQLHGGWKNTAAVFWFEDIYGREYLALDEMRSDYYDRYVRAYVKLFLFCAMKMHGRQET
jgi:hypothetical protein